MRRVARLGAGADETRVFGARCKWGPVVCWPAGSRDALFGITASGPRHETAGYIIRISAQWQIVGQGTDRWRLELLPALAQCGRFRVVRPPVGSVVFGPSRRSTDWHGRGQCPSHSLKQTGERSTLVRTVSAGLWSSQRCDQRSLACPGWAIGRQAGHDSSTTIGTFSRQAALGPG